MSGLGTIVRVTYPGRSPALQLFSMACGDHTAQLSAGALRRRSWASPVVVVQGGRGALLQLLCEALQEGAPPGRRAQRGHKVRLHRPHMAPQAF